MRIINCLFAILLAQLCTAQQVIRKVTNSPDGAREVYYVLASDSSTLHGRYTRSERTTKTEGFYKNGLQDGVWTVTTLQPKKFIRVQGPFKDGKRNGLWTVYSSKKKLKTKGYFTNDQRTAFWRYFNANGEVEEEGNYIDDLRVGKWSFYDDKGNMVQEYDYTKKNVVSDVLLPVLQQRPFRVINGADTASSLLQRPPLFVGGKARLNKSKIIQYPIKPDSVKVEIRFTVDKLGKARDFYVAKSMGRWYDQEAMYTVKQLPSTWVPAVHNGATVDVEHSLTVKFSKVNMRTEPFTYYRDVFNNNNYQSVGQPGFGRTRTNVFHSPGFSYQACKIQIL